jgi:phosphoribosylformylglycinamidine synthase
VIGHVTDTGHMVLTFNGETVCDIPLDPLADDAPLYDRPWVRTEAPAALGDVAPSTDIAADLLKLMASPDLASRRWIWEQYDHMVGADTVQRPGGDAAVVRVHGTRKGLAITTDCTPRYCYADPYEGGKQAIAETWRNLTAVGATPLAATDCMNFGNPQRPEIMGQFVGCIEGMAEACRALDYPIVSGNVSLYNETKNDDGTGSAILPTPAIGGVGLLSDYETSATIALKGEAFNEDIILIGETKGHLGQSLWLREIRSLDGKEAGPPPPVDLAKEKSAGDLVRKLIQSGHVNAVHDVSDGGVLVAVAEMALAGNRPVDFHPSFASTEQLFGEDQGRYVVATSSGSDVLEAARMAGVSAQMIARSQNINTDDPIIFCDQPGLGSWSVSLTDLRTAHEGFFPKLMG